MQIDFPNWDKTKELTYPEGKPTIFKSDCWVCAHKVILHDGEMCYNTGQAGYGDTPQQAWEHYCDKKFTASQYKSHLKRMSSVFDEDTNTISEIWNKVKGLFGGGK